MAPKKQPLLGRLQRAVEKVRVLLSIDKSRWLLSSFLTRTSSTRPRRLSFKNPPAGLLDCIDGDSDSDGFHEVGSTFVLSRTTSMATDRSRSTTPVSDITRSSSGVSSTDDIDRRADDFIANFYKHIQMERQVSLELRYLRAKDGSLHSDS